MAREVEYVETAAVPDFQEYFMEALAFPDISDETPNRKAISR